MNNSSKQTVVAVQKRHNGRGMVWVCTLACGHKVERTVKSRRSTGAIRAPLPISVHNPDPARVEDPAPTWVHCESC